MKKHMMHKRYLAHAETGPDIAGMINKMQEQIVSLERKIDTLIGSPERRPASYRGGSRQDNSYRERTLHKAICADCNKECEVPFTPSGGRPVYCKVCFSKRKAEGRPVASHRNGGSPEGRPAVSYRGGGNQPKERFDNRPREVIHPQANHIDKPHGGDSPEGHPAASYRGGGKKNYAEKKKPPAKRRKERA